MNKISIIHDIIFLGDVHLEEDSIEECFAILDEIIKTYPRDMVLVQLGDLTDKNKLNAVELEALTEFVSTLAKHFKKLIFIDGNHSKLDKNNSIINYLRFLNNNIEVYQDELAIDHTSSRINNGRGQKIVIGHFFLDTSNGAFGDFRYKAEELAEMFDYGFFGHQHDYQDKLAQKKFFCHLGSARYTSFGENLKLPKYYAVLSERLEFHEIKALTPLVDVHSLEELETISKDYKVRYIITSFEQLKNEIDLLKKYKNKFKQFKIHNQFIKTANTQATPESKEKFNSKEMIYTWIDKIEDKEVKELLVKSFEDTM